MLKIIKKLIVSLFFFLLFSCTTIREAYFTDQKFDPRADSWAIEIYHKGTIIDKEYLLLGMVTAHYMPGQYAGIQFPITRKKTDEIIEGLKQKARIMGGDAIMEFDIYQAPYGTVGAGTYTIQGKVIRWKVQKSQNNNSSQDLGQGNQFKSEYVDFAIPNFWTESNSDNFKNENVFTITNLKWLDHQFKIFASIKDQDAAANYNSQAWLKTFGQTYIAGLKPSGNAKLKDTIITTKNNLNSSYEIWKGQVTNSDKTLNYYYSVTTIKPNNKKGKWILIVGIYPPFSDDVEKELKKTVTNDTPDNINLRGMENNIKIILDSIK